VFRYVQVMCEEQSSDAQVALESIDIADGVEEEANREPKPAVGLGNQATAPG
jgi:hypothetical protein